MCTNNIFPTYLIGPFYASPNLTPTPFTPTLITPQLNVFHFKTGRNLIQTPYAGLQGFCFVFAWSAKVRMAVANFQN